MKDAETKARRKLAGAIQTKVAGAGVVCLLRDAEGRAHLIPGHEAELVAVYSDGVKSAWIREDLEAAEIHK